MVCDTRCGVCGDLPISYYVWQIPKEIWILTGTIIYDVDFGIVLISGMKALLCKGFSLGGFLLLFWIKGRQLRFNSDEWDSFFISLPERKLQKYVICIYLVAAMFSSFISYFILELTGYRNSIGIAILIFAVGVLITACKWHTKERDYLLRRYREIPDTILERQKQETEEIEKSE